MSDENGSSFAPSPVSSGGGRRPLVVAGLVVAVVAGSFAIARLAPGPGPGKAIETNQPTTTTALPTSGATVAEAEPTATALPRLEWYTAPSAPIHDVLVQTDQTRWLRLSGARIEDEVIAQAGDDLLLLGGGSSTVCLCWQAPGTESGDPRALDLVRRRGDLTEISRTTVMVVNGLAMDGRDNAPLQVALEASPDGRVAYLARAVRSATQWQVSLDVIDLVTGAVTDTVELISFQQSDRSVVLTVEPPNLRVAPDGRHVLLIAGTERLTSTGPVSSTRHAWVIDTAGSTLGRVEEVDDIADASSNVSAGPCAWVTFASPSVIAKGCRYRTEAGSSFEIRRYDLAGHTLDPIVVDASMPAADQVVVATGRGMVYAWDPASHRLLAVDLVRGGWVTAAPPSDDRANPEAVDVQGPRPPIGPPTAWSDGRSASGPSVARMLIGSPDGRLLYAIGTGPNENSSSGVWVFDVQTLKLLERWPARGSYESMTSLEDGQWLVAIGRPGVTATGGPAEWGSSVTVHDTLSGLPVLRIGDVGATEDLVFPWSGPVAAAK